MQSLNEFLGGKKKEEETHKEKGTHGSGRIYIYLQQILVDLFQRPPAGGSSSRSPSACIPSKRRRKQDETYARGNTAFIQILMHGYKDTWVIGFFGHRVHLLFDLHVGMIISILLFFRYPFSLRYIIYLIFISIGYIIYLTLFGPGYSGYRCGTLFRVFSFQLSG